MTTIKEYISKKYWEKSTGFIKAKCEMCGEENSFENRSNGKLFHRKFKDFSADGSHADDECIVILCHECFMKIMS